MKRGSITVFSAISMMLIVSLLFALLESARVYGLDYYAEVQTDAGVISACAEYQPLLWQKYRLLALDAAYGGEEFSMDNVTRHIREKIEKNLNHDITILNFLGIDLFQLNLKEATPISYQLMTDGNGEVFLNQISEVMKEMLPIEMAEELYKSYTKGEEIENGQEDVTVSVDNAQTMIQEAKEQKQAEGQAQDISIEENPLEFVSDVKKSGLLNLVLEDTSGVSAEKIDLSDALENRSRQEGNIQLSVQADWYRKILVLKYLEEYYTNYTNGLEGHDLAYEMEFIIGGKESEEKNLEKAVNRLVLIREAANVTYILSDRDKMNLAETLANAIGVLFSGNQAAVMAIKIAIVGAWAFLESVLDLRTLLGGGRIALIKNEDEWTTDVENLAESFQSSAKAKECESGWYYREYLQQIIFFMRNEELAYRMMEVIEHYLRKEEESKYGCMDHMVVRMNYQLTYTAEPLFYSLSVLGAKMKENFLFQKKRDFSYIP